MTKFKAAVSTIIFLKSAMADLESRRVGTSLRFSVICGDYWWFLAVSAVKEEAR